MQQFSRPQAAREIEARARARQLGVRVEVIEPGQHYQTRSQSEPGVVYNIVRTPVGWTCECKGYRLSGGVCKHIAQVERRSEREGWAFGRFAPRPRFIENVDWSTGVISDTIHDRRARLGLAPVA